MSTFFINTVLFVFFNLINNNQFDVARGDYYSKNDKDSYLTINTDGTYYYRFINGDFYRYSRGVWFVDDQNFLVLVSKCDDPKDQEYYSQFAPCIDIDSLYIKIINDKKLMINSVVYKYKD